MPERPKPGELPVLQPTPGIRVERSNAARNREAVLSTARRLFDERGVANVSMDEIAAEAGVGKGTVYRRFGDRAGLALALLETEDTGFQEHLLRGPPPLGPGAPPRARISAFFDALGRLLDEHGDLMAEAERAMPADTCFASGPYVVYHTHLRLLLQQLNPSLDVDLLAHVLLAPFRAQVYNHLTGRTPDTGRQRLLTLVEQVLDGLDGEASAPRLPASAS